MDQREPNVPIKKICSFYTCRYGKWNCLVGRPEEGLGTCGARATTGTMTRLGHGLTPLESTVNAPQLRVAQSGSHGFRLFSSDVFILREKKCTSFSPFQNQMNNHGIRKSDLQRYAIRPRRSLGCRASSAVAGAGDLPSELADDSRSGVSKLKQGGSKWWNERRG